MQLHPHLIKLLYQLRGAEARLGNLFGHGAGQSLDVGSDEDLKQHLLTSAEFYVQYLMAGIQQSKNSNPISMYTNAVDMLNPAVNARSQFLIPMPCDPYPRYSVRYVVTSFQRCKVPDLLLCCILAQSIRIYNSERQIEVG